MGSDMSKKYPTNCNDMKELPTNKYDFIKLLKYIRKSKKMSKGYESKVDFNYDNITTGILNLNLRIHYLNELLYKYNHCVDWNAQIIFDSLRNKFTHPCIVVKSPDLNWNYTGITDNYMHLINIYDIKWDINFIEQTITYFGEETLFNEKNIEHPWINKHSIYRFILKNKHHYWNFKDRQIQGMIYYDIITKDGELFGYDWNKDLLKHACSCKKDNAVYVHNLDPWILDYTQYKVFR